jgi:uncharacterized protein
LTQKRNHKFSGVALALVIGCLGVAAFVAARSYHGARSEIEADPPSPLLRQPNAVGVADMQPVSFVTRDGLRIAAWYVASKNRAAVLVTHGTNSDRASMLPEIRILSDAGFGVLAFDWPGLGESEGTIRWDSAARNALGSAIEWMSSRSGIDPSELGALGFSMGGYLVTQVAAHDTRLRAIVLESAPSDFEAFLRIHYSKWGPLSLWPARCALSKSDLLDADWTAAHLIGRISPRPVLIIGQAADPVIPLEMTQLLYESARTPKSLWLIPGDRHGGYLEATDGEYARRLKAFFVENLLRADNAAL